MKLHIFEAVVFLATGILLSLPHLAKAQYPLTNSVYTSPPWVQSGNFGVHPILPGSFSITGGPFPDFPRAEPGFAIRVNPFVNQYTEIISPPPPDLANLHDSIRSVEVKDSYAYIVVESWDTYLWVADVSDPENPDVIKKIKIGRYPSFEIFLHGDYLYWIAHGPGGGYNLDIDDEDIVGVYDISDPLSPDLIDTLSLDFGLIGPPRTFFTQDMLYIFYEDVEEEENQFKSSLVKIDISDPANLSQVSFGEIDFWDEEAQILDQITVRGDLAYLSGGTIYYSGLEKRDYTGNFYILDISDLEHLALISTTEFQDEIIPFRGQALLDNYMVLIGGTSGLLVIDINDPTDPEVVATVELAGPEQITIKDHIAYISDHYRGLEVVDLSDPEAPVRINGYRLTAHYKGYYGIQDMAVEGNIFYSVIDSYLQMWDISEPWNIDKIGLIGEVQEEPDIRDQIASGSMTLILTKDAQDMVSLGKDGDIAIFDIDSLDELNKEYGIYKITPKTSTVGFNAFTEDRFERSYIIEFPKSVDMFDIYIDYMDNPYCLFAEFRYQGALYGISGYYPPGFLGNPYPGFYPTPAPFGSAISPLNQPIDSWRYQTGLPGSINPSLRSPIFPGLNLGLPGQIYPPGFTSSGQNPYTLFQGTIFPGGNGPWTNPFNTNPLIPNLNQAGFNTLNPGQYSSVPWGVLNPYTINSNFLSAGIDILPFFSF